MPKEPEKKLRESAAALNAQMGYERDMPGAEQPKEEHP